MNNNVWIDYRERLPDFDEEVILYDVYEEKVALGYFKQRRDNGRIYVVFPDVYLPLRHFIENGFGLWWVPNPLPPTHCKDETE